MTGKTGGPAAAASLPFLKGANFFFASDHKSLDRPLAPVYPQVCRADLPPGPDHW